MVLLLALIDDTSGAVEADRVLDIPALDLPGIGEGEPHVRDFDLVSVPDDLPEDAVLVAEPVPPGVVVEGGEGVQEAGRQPAQPAVAQRGVHLLVVYLLEHVAQLLDCLPVVVLKLDVDDRVS